MEAPRLRGGMRIILASKILLYQSRESSRSGSEVRAGETPPALAIREVVLSNRDPDHKETLRFCVLSLMPLCDHPRAYIHAIVRARRVS